MIILRNIQKIKVCTSYSARIPKFQYKFLMKMSEKIFRACKCKGLARIDYIMSNKNGKIYFLELNTSWFD